MIVIVIEIPKAIQVCQGGVPNGENSFTTCHLREWQEIQPTCQRYAFPPTVFLEKAKPPIHRRWKKQWLGFGQRLCYERGCGAP